MNKPHGTLFIFAAASGTGKTSLVEALLKNLTDIKISISHTTRPKRPAEIDGEHYHFLGEKTFEQLIADHDFLEHANVHGNYYGTSKVWLEQQLNAGIDVILEIDWQGAQQVRGHMQQAVSVFILPPSAAALAERLENRKQDSPDVIARRLAAASQEIEHCNEFDYLVVNDDFDEALATLQAIVLAERQRQPRMAQQFAPLLAELVKK